MSSNLEVERSHLVSQHLREDVPTHFKSTREMSMSKLTVNTSKGTVSLLRSPR